ncbi:Craniofacial development protein 1 [Strongyloides ratti]|uniref:Craniofacial development protein 1 n=1 Tax=Strongyloides ratti TaxID=34506 RepID=A0A090LD50_STRRB|nr:Craniofacial development protein 1 [Strongyloides ratti]CEF67681.1 Craniofacial development protein 1 [Strongyloides ratti]
MNKELLDDNNYDDEEDVDYTPESENEEDIIDKEVNLEVLEIKTFENKSENNDEEKKSEDEDDEEVYKQLLEAGNIKCQVTTDFTKSSTASKIINTKINSIPIKRSAKSSGLLDIADSTKKKKTTSLSQCTESWKKYVTSKGIAEELVSFNKGKNGFLARQDFLAKTDLRQFEKEKEARNALRKSKQ